MVFVKVHENSVRVYIIGKQVNSISESEEVAIEVVCEYIEVAITSERLYN